MSVTYLQPYFYMVNFLSYTALANKRHVKHNFGEHLESERLDIEKRIFSSVILLAS